MRSLNNDPVIISAIRTPIGKYGGALASLRADDMLAELLRESVNQLPIEASTIDEVIAGCANQAGEDNRNIARMAALLAGLPDSIPAITLNRLCASGLDAIIAAARRIITGEASLVIAGGVESMSRAPYVMGKAPSPYHLGAPEVYDTSLGWRFFNHKMKDITPPEANGVTAERLAERYGISRLRQDQFALRSHKLAITAQDRGLFKQEIKPLSLTSKRGESVLIDKDEQPRADSSMDQLSLLKPAFLPGGSVTAGNSSSLNDGASVLVIASRDLAKRIGVDPLARIIAFASAGVDPRLMGLGPVPATKKLLANSGLSIGDFNAFEINEAFAAQVLCAIDLLGIDEGLINQRGGAIALGHPLGCSGARIVTTMLHRMRDEKLPLGLTSLCVGVGQGVSMAIEAM